MSRTNRTTVRTAEARVRRAAKRKGYLLRKSRSRDKWSNDFGLYVLVDDCKGNRLPGAQAPYSAFERGEGETLERIEEWLTEVVANRPYAGKPTDEQIRIAQSPHLYARTITMRRQSVLIVHRNIATDKSSEMYRPVREYLARHPHEVMVDPKVEPEPTWGGAMGEVVFYRLVGNDA